MFNSPHLIDLLFGTIEGNILRFLCQFLHFKLFLSFGCLGADIVSMRVRSWGNDSVREVAKRCVRL